MNIKEIKELIEVVSQHGITDLEVERSGVKVRIRKDGQPVVVSSVPAHSTYAFPTGYPPAAAPAVEGANATVPSVPVTTNEDEGLLHVRSPIVGTFYRSPNPDADPFVKAGIRFRPYSASSRR
jgi:biotin carboxyl carrier protein